MSSPAVSTLSTKPNMRVRVDLDTAARILSSGKQEVSLIFRSPFFGQVQMVVDGKRVGKGEVVPSKAPQ